MQRQQLVKGKLGIGHGEQVDSKLREELVEIETRCLWYMHACAIVVIRGGNSVACDNIPMRRGSSLEI
jgi:hypothetical protein